METNKTRRELIEIGRAAAADAKCDLASDILAILDAD